MDDTDPDDELREMIKFYLRRPFRDETMVGSDAVKIEDLPPSAKLVFKVLEYNGSLTQKQIVQESMLSARTVRYALERLQQLGVVEEDVYFPDARQNLYSLNGDAILSGSNLDGACLAE